MTFLTKYRIPLILQCLVFLLPLSIEIIGDWIAVRIRWAFFTFQQTYQVPYSGSSLFPLGREIMVISGGRSLISGIIWAAGGVLFMIAVFLLVYTCIKDTPALVKKASLLTIMGGLLLLVALVVQYGITLQSMAGFAIPIGVPVILIIGWGMYTVEEYESDDADTGQEDGEETDPE
jgi:hypothetical protein